MKVADLLRAMVSMVDSAEQESASTDQKPTIVVVNNPTTQTEPAAAPAATPAHALTPVAVPQAPAPQTAAKPEAEKTTMVPPLQQKIELLKRAVAVDNEFDNGFDQIDQEEGKSQPDELARMRKMAGLNSPIQQELVKDEPLDI